MVQVGSSLRRW